MAAEQGYGQELLRALAKEARKQPTAAEKSLWEMLRNHRCGGLGFRRQVTVGPFRLDFYCPARKLAIEVDGDVHLQPEAQQRDKDRQTILETDFGICFLRFSNTEVLQNPQKVRDSVLSVALVK